MDRIIQHDIVEPATAPFTPSLTPPLLVDRKEASRLLNLSLRKLDAATKAGRIPCVRIGRRVLYSVDALREWISEQSRQGGKRR